jgi:carboxylesterase type B
LVYELFLKVSKNYITPAYDYEPPALDKMADFATNLGANAASLAEKLSGTNLGGGAKATLQEVPPSLSHSFAKAAFQSAELLGQEEPFGAALKKFAATQEKMGESRLLQDQNAAAKFYYPFSRTMDGKIGESMVLSLFLEIADLFL